MCPHAKLQKVCDTVLNGQPGSGATGAKNGGNFGAVGAANLLIMQSKSSAAGGTKSQKNMAH